MLRLCMTEADGLEENIAVMDRPSTIDYENTCKFPSNSSILIMSIGRHISIEKVDLSDSLGFNITNLRRTFRVTVGRLSWETTDLAKEYDAECSASANCEGLYFPLSNNQHALVGKASVPKPQVVHFPDTFDEWQVLARADTAISDTMQGDILYLPAYPLATNSPAWAELSVGTLARPTSTTSSSDTFIPRIHCSQPTRPDFSGCYKT